jgi:hypothetical protein
MDSAVLIQSLTGTTKWLVIEDREDLNPERHEFGVSHPIVAAVLGKSKGEKVQIHCGTYAPEEYEIKEIVHKYAYAAFDSMEQFAELFPGESGPLKVRLPHLDGEDSLDFGQVREIMARNAARTEESINLYKAGLLTVGAFADFINKHLLDVMWLLIRNEGLSLIALNGSTEERNQQAQCANLPSASFVLDLTAVASIVRFSSVSELPVTLRERCEVAQSSIDTLRAELSFLKSAHVGGYNMLTMVYGQLGIREVGEKDVNDQIEFFVSVLEWIERNTTVSTSGAELSVDGAVKEKLNDVIGCAFVDSALIASGGNRILVSDDCQFRALAFNEYKVQGIWSGAFIKLAFGTTDSQQQMSDYLIRAISSGYRSIPVDDALLLEAARRANWGTGSPFENVVASLRDKSWIAQTLYDVVASFFVKLWMEPIPSGRRDSIAIALVSTLAAEHNPIEVVKSLKQHISRRTRLLPLFEYEMDDVLTTWLRHQLH